MEKYGEIRADLTPPEDAEKQASDEDCLEEHLLKRCADCVCEHKESTA